VETKNNRKEWPHAVWVTTNRFMIQLVKFSLIYIHRVTANVWQKQVIIQSCSYSVGGSRAEDGGTGPQVLLGSLIFETW